MKPTPDVPPREACAVAIELRDEEIRSLRRTLLLERADKLEAEARSMRLMVAHQVAVEEVEVLRARAEAAELDALRWRGMGRGACA